MSILSNLLQAYKQKLSKYRFGKGKGILNRINKLTDRPELAFKPEAPFKGVKKLNAQGAGPKHLYNRFNKKFIKDKVRRVSKIKFKRRQYMLNLLNE